MITGYRDSSVRPRPDQMHDVLSGHVQTSDTGSDANSSTFLLQERYLILLSVSGAADLLGSDPNELKIDGAPRIVLAGWC